MTKKLLIAVAFPTITIFMLIACSNGESSEKSIESPAKELDSDTETQGLGESGKRLAAIQSRGKVVCAIDNSVPGFGFADETGNIVGFSIDICRAVAVAVLGDAYATEFRSMTYAERGPALQSGEIDMMTKSTTWTSSRDAEWGNFAQTIFYDGQGFMVPKDIEVHNLLDLKGSKICVAQGTTTELNVQDFNNENNMNMDIIIFPDLISTNAAYLAGQCDSLTSVHSEMILIDLF